MFRLRILLLMMLAVSLVTALVVEGRTVQAEKRVSLNRDNLFAAHTACQKSGGIGLTSATFVLEGSPFVLPDLTVEFDLNRDLLPDRTSIVAPEAGSTGGEVLYEVLTFGLIIGVHADVPDDWEGSIAFKESHCDLGTPPANSCAPWPGRTVLQFDQHLGDPNNGLSSIVDIPFSASGIREGVYDVTLKSFDAHSEHGGQGQQHEQWHALFRTEQGTVATQPIDDLPDAQNILHQRVGRITLPGRLTSIVLVHERSEEAGHAAGFETPESVFASCIALDRIGDLPAVAGEPE